MIRLIVIISFLFLNACSTFKKDVVECPKLIVPKKAAEIVVYSESNSPVYLGFRGVQMICFKDGDDILMELSVNIRVVSVDLKEKEFDRDEFNYSQFLLKGSKIVDRATTFDLKIPSGGKVLLGIK